MIITLKKDASAAEARKIVRQIEEKGLSVTVIEGANYNVYGVVGDTTVLDEKVIAANPAVDHVQRVAAPYKKANSIFHPTDSVIDVAGIKVGGISRAPRLMRFKGRELPVLNGLLRCASVTACRSFPR